MKETIEIILYLLIMIAMIVSFVKFIISSSGKRRRKNIRYHDNMEELQDQISENHRDIQKLKKKLRKNK